MSKIVLCGGGTAGHIMPHIALLDKLKKHFSEIYYIGSPSSMEQDISAKYNLKFFSIECVKLKRSLTIKNLSIPFKLIASVNSAKKILNQIKPGIVFSKGGYVSLPVVIAASKLGIPVVSHESDLTPGLANKVAKHYCKCICTSFEECAIYFKKKGVYTKTPIRQQLFLGNRNTFLSKYDVDIKKENLLFMGGSSGAKRLNEVIRLSLDELLKAYNIIHLTGKGNISSDIKKQGYIQIDFTESIEDIFAAADYVICRAGSNSIFEMLALSKPMLLIPLPKGASRGDQIDNAKYMESRELAKLLLQENLDKKTLLSSIKNLSIDKEKLISNIKKYDFNGGIDNVLKEILRYRL